jgi:hypothetical protein
MNIEVEFCLGKYLLSFLFLYLNYHMKVLDHRNYVRFLYLEDFTYLIPNETMDNERRIEM